MSCPYDSLTNQVGKVYRSLSTSMRHNWGQALMLLLRADEHCSPRSYFDRGFAQPSARTGRTIPTRRSPFALAQGERGEQCDTTKPPFTLRLGSGRTAQAQPGWSGDQRLKRCVAAAARRDRVFSQSCAQAAASRSSDSGLARLRATKSGKSGRPDGWPTGW